MLAKPLIRGSGRRLGADLENGVIKPQKEWGPGCCLVTYSALTKVSVSDGENPYIEKEAEDNEEIEVISTVDGKSPEVVDLEDKTETFYNEAIDVKEEPLERNMSDKRDLKDASPIYSEDEDEKYL